ncbi:MAG TPA: hypothetical protein VF290_17780 [Pyrinomonadaceae bacterium]
MSQKITDSDSIKRYLLGELSGEELDAVELRMLSDADYYEQVLIADEELMHEFVNHELSARDRATFQKILLSVPQRRQDVNFVKAVEHYANKNAVQNVVPVKPVVVRRSWGEVVVAFFRRPAVGFACCIAFLITVAPALWLFRENRRLRNELAQFPSKQAALQVQLLAEKEKNRVLTADFERERALSEKGERESQQFPDREQQIVRSSQPAPESTSSLVTFAIALPGTREIGETNKVSFPPGAKKVRLNIDLAANDYKTYRVALKRNNAGRYVWSGPTERVIVESEKTTLPVLVPTSILTRAEYQLDVRGIASSGKSEPLATYYFRVP